MLTAEKVQQLKQVNVSANNEATKTRTKELIRGATEKQKLQIEKLSGLKRISFRRMFSTGNVSAKNAVAIGQSLNVSPFYITGEIDTAGTCDAATLDAFLRSKGYGDLTKAKRKNSLTNSIVSLSQPPMNLNTESANDKPTANKTTAAVSKSAKKTNTRKPAKVMSEDEAVQLVRSLFVRTKYDNSLTPRLSQLQGILV